MIGPENRAGRIFAAPSHAYLVSHRSAQLRAQSKVLRKETSLRKISFARRS
jgi:hypothetical protein